MINLLPYNRRMLLKSRYKRRLFIVAISGITITLFPFVIVIIIMILVQYSNISILNVEYQKAKEFKSTENSTLLSEKLKGINDLIYSFSNNLENKKIVSDTVLKIMEIKPIGITINSFDFSTNTTVDVLILNGVSVNRNEIIKYEKLLKEKPNGLCSVVNIPVTTYSKAFDVPFTISCTLSYE